MNKRGFAGTLITVVIVLIIVFLFIKFGPKISDNLITGKALENFNLKKGCIDSDRPSDYPDRESYNIYKKGTVYSYSESCLKSLKDCKSNSEIDTCVDEHNLKEFYCLNEQILSSVVWCVNNCESGKCS